MSYVSIGDGILVGFAHMTMDGYLSHLYVHKDFQRQRIASDLLQRVEQEGSRHGTKQISTDASITATPFFERKGLLPCACGMSRDRMF